MNSSGKAAAASAALELIQPGMRVGLGTGTTVDYFLQGLGEKCRRGLVIKALASSIATEVRARSLGIPLVATSSLTALDITVDGADEVDDKKRLIKGGGGALLREKLLAYMADEMVVIVDTSKVVTSLGGAPLPVEVIPFAYTVTQHHIEKTGYPAKLRLNENDGSLFITDNGNYILDVKLPSPCPDIEALDSYLHSIPGVVETGFFLGLAKCVIVGDGTVNGQSYS